MIYQRVYKVHNLKFYIRQQPNEHRMEIENGIVYPSVINAQIRKNANINVKKLSSLKHCVRSQINV